MVGQRCHGYEPKARRRCVVRYVLVFSRVVSKQQVAKGGGVVGGQVCGGVCPNAPSFSGTRVLPRRRSSVGVKAVRQAAWSRLASRNGVRCAGYRALPLVRAARLASQQGAAVQTQNAQVPSGGGWGWCTRAFVAQQRS